MAKPKPPTNSKFVWQTDELRITPPLGLRKRPKQPRKPKGKPKA